MRPPQAAGEKMYVDFCGDTAAVVDGTRCQKLRGHLAYLNFAAAAEVLTAELEPATQQ